MAEQTNEDNEKNQNKTNILKAFLLSLLLIGAMFESKDQFLQLQLFTNVSIDDKIVEHDYNRSMLGQSVQNETKSVDVIDTNSIKSLKRLSDNYNCFNFEDKTIDSLKRVNIIASGNNNQSALIQDIKLNFTRNELKYFDQLYDSSKLKIFTNINSKREPDIHSLACGIPIDSFLINQDYYYINQKVYTRSCGEFSRWCQHLDWLQMLTYLYDAYSVTSDNPTKYILVGEDDIKFCPVGMFSYLYNLTLLDEWNGIEINMVFLGAGSTAFLIKTEFIPRLVEWISDTPNDTGLSYAEKKYEEMSKPIDIWINRNQKDGLLNGIFSSMPTMVSHRYDPPGVNNASTLGHHIAKKSVFCYVDFGGCEFMKTTVSSYFIEAFAMNIKHASDYRWANLWSNNKRAGPQRKRWKKNDCIHNVDYNVNLKLNVSTTNCTKAVLHARVG